MQPIKSTFATLVLTYLIQFQFISATPILGEVPDVQVARQLIAQEIRESRQILNNLVHNEDVYIDDVSVRQKFFRGLKLLKAMSNYLNRRSPMIHGSLEYKKRTVKKGFPNESEVKKDEITFYTFEDIAQCLDKIVRLFATVHNSSDMAFHLDGESQFIKARNLLESSLSILINSKPPVNPSREELLEELEEGFPFGTSHLKIPKVVTEADKHFAMYLLNDSSQDSKGKILNAYFSQHSASQREGNYKSNLCTLLLRIGSDWDMEKTIRLIPAHVDEKTFTRLTARLAFIRPQYVHRFLSEEF